MKIKCINNDGWEKYLTNEETYEVIKIDDEGDYQIIDDIGIKCIFNKNRFKTLSELRNEKIDKLLEL